MNTLRVRLHLSRNVTNPTILVIAPEMTQISLNISLLCSFYVLVNGLSFLQADKEYSDETVFLGHKARIYQAVIHLYTETL